MKKRILMISGIVLIVLCACFIYLKYYLLKARDFKPDNSKSRSFIDLRPSVIAKLQQLVKDGSNGLYILSIGKIYPDVLASTLDVVNASLVIDTAVMKQLDTKKKLPDDLFTIHFDSLHIDGIGIDHLLHRKSIDITRVNISNPSIEVYHKSQVYNRSQRDRNDTLSLYHRIREQMNSIIIGQINIEKGTLIMHEDPQQKNITKLKEVTILMNDLRVDSSTQFDTNRFLFAKELNIDAKNYIAATPDSLYYFKTGSLSVVAAQHRAVLENVELDPRGNKAEFESKLKFRHEMLQLRFKKVVLDDVDWWAMIDHDKFVAKEGEITGGYFKVFLDRTLSSNPVINVANFPHQLLMKLAIPVSVDHLLLKDIDVAYEEFNPGSKQSGTAYFDNLNGRLNYASNIPAVIRAHPVADFSAKGMFMHQVPMTAGFTFDLTKHKTGEFTADIQLEALDNQTINSLSEPLGLFSLKSGELQEGTIHIEGNNFNTKGKVRIAYTNLHITPLKDADESGQLRKKTVSSFIANVFLIKNSNPEKGKKLREPEFSMERDHRGNFFNMIWVTTLTGILKTIGIPVKLVIH